MLLLEDLYNMNLSDAEHLLENFDNFVEKFNSYVPEFTDALEKHPDLKKRLLKRLYNLYIDLK